MPDDSQSGLRDRIARQGEDALGKIAQELLENPLVNSAIAKAYEDVGLPTGVAHEGMRTYGVPRATVRRALAGVPMSRLLDYHALAR
jgi:hypothetical protein